MIMKILLQVQREAKICVWNKIVPGNRPVQHMENCPVLQRLQYYSASEHIKIIE